MTFKPESRLIMINYLLIICILLIMYIAYNAAYCKLLTHVLFILHSVILCTNSNDYSRKWLWCFNISRNRKRAYIHVGDLILSYKITHVTFSEIIFLTRQGPKVSDLYFIIWVSTIVNPNASYINCHLQLCHLHSTLE